jgi:hypothetical protein
MSPIFFRHRSTLAGAQTVQYLRIAVHSGWTEPDSTAFGRLSPDCGTMVDQPDAAFDIDGGHLLES